jgi:hypothetical protein
MIDQAMLFNGSSRFKFAYWVLVISFMVVATGCGGGGGNGSPGERSIAEQNALKFSIDISNANVDAYSYESTKVSIAGVEKETFYDIQIRDDQIKGSGTIRDGNTTEIVLDIEQVVDDDLYVVIYECPANSTDFCNLANPIHMVLSGAQLKQGGYTATVLTELAYQKIAYYVNTDFSASEIFEVLNKFANGLFKNDFRSITEGYEQLLLAWDPSNMDQLSRPDLVQEITQALQTEVDGARLQSFLGDLEDPRVFSKNQLQYGKDIKISDGFAYMLTGLGYIQIVNIEDDADRSVVANIEASNGEVQNYVVEGGFAYLLTSDYLEAFDVSDPTNPQQLVTFKLEEGPVDHVLLSEKKLLLFSDNKIDVVDVSSPTEPRIISRKALESIDPNESVQFVSVENKKLIVLANSGYYLFDINDLNSISLLQFEEALNSYLICSDSETNIRIICIGEGEIGGETTIVAIDLSTTDRFTVKTVEHSTIGSNLVEDVALYDNQLLVASQYDYLAIYDLKDFDNPTKVDSDSRLRSTFLEIINDQLYTGVSDVNFDIFGIHENDPGFLAFDLAGLPNLTASVGLAKVWYESADTMLTHNGYGYASLQGGGIAVIDLSEPQSPKHVQTYNLPRLNPDSYREIFDIEINNGMIIVTTDDSGLYILDLNGDPENPVLLSNQVLEYEGEPLNGRAISVADDAVYIAFGEEDFYGLTDFTGVGIVDISEPTNPRLINVVEYEMEVYDVLVNNTTLYVTTSESLMSYSIGQDFKLSLQDTLEFDLKNGLDPDTNYYVFISSLRDLAISNGTLYLVAREGKYDEYDYRLVSESRRLEVIDVSSGDQLINKNRSFSDVESIQILGTTLYGKLDKGFGIFDLTIPDHPKLVAEYDSDFFSGFLSVSERYAYLGGRAPSIRDYMVRKYSAMEAIELALLTSDKQSVLVNELPLRKTVLPMLRNSGYGFTIGADGSIGSIDLSDPLAQLSEAYFSPHSGNIEDFVMAENYIFAYVADHIDVFDFSNMASPIWVTSLDMGSDGLHLSKLIISGDYIYAGAWDGIRVINVSNPEMPVQEEPIVPSSAETILRNIEYSENLKQLYATVDLPDKTRVMDVISLSDSPSGTGIPGQDTFNCSNNLQCRDIAIADTKEGDTWILDYGDGLGIYNTNSASYSFNYNDYTHDIMDVATFNEHFIIGSVDGEINIINPRRSFTEPVSSLNLNYGSIQSIELAGGYAFVESDYTTGATLIDLSENDPTIIESSFNFNGWAKMLATLDNTTLFSLSGGEMDVIDITSITDPEPLISLSSLGSSSSFVVENQYMYVVDDGQLKVLAVNDNDERSLVTAIPQDKSTSYYSVAKYENSLYLLDSEYSYNSDERTFKPFASAIHKYDIGGDPRRPALSHTLELDNPAYKIVIDGDLLYSIGENTLEIFRVSSLSADSLTKRASYQIDYPINGVERMGEDIVFTSDIGLVLGKLDPIKQEVGEIRVVKTPGKALSLDIVENYVYVADSKAGLVIVDVTDSDKPKLAYVVGTKGTPKNVYVEPDTSSVVLHTSYGIEVMKTISGTVN